MCLEKGRKTDEKTRRKKNTDRKTEILFENAGHLCDKVDLQHDLRFPAIQEKIDERFAEKKAHSFSGLEKTHTF